jgi:hypothetical protein
VLIAAFEGWNDAGDAASGAVEHLEREWSARTVAAIDPDDYYDFQVNRPTVSLVDGHTRRITWPTTRVSVCRLGEADRDVVLVRGLEPNMRWRGFCEELLAVAAQLEVELVVTLGALLADSPHTRPVPVSGDGLGREAMRALGLERSRYEGPTGIVGVFPGRLHVGRAARGVLLGCGPALRRLAAVPQGDAGAAAPDRGPAGPARPARELPEQARLWERSVDEIAADDAEVQAYVASLEEREPEEDLPEASGEAIAKEFERYLRRGGDDSRG